MIEFVSTFGPIVVGVGAYLKGAPTGVVAALLIVAIPITALIVYLHAKAVWIATEEELVVFRAATPLIECLPPKGALVTSYSGHQFYVVQARFRNSPGMRTGRASDKNVSARIEFWDSNRSVKSLETFGQWAEESIAPDHVGWLKLSPTIDFEANDLPRKLYVALRPPEVAEAYAFCAENLDPHPEGQHPDYRLAFSTYCVCVTLRGPKVNANFWFELNNPGHQNLLDLEPIGS